MWLTWMIVLGVNTLLCLIAGLLLVLLVPKRWRNRYAYALIVLPGIVIPVLSVFGVILMSLLVCYYSRLKTIPNVATVGYQGLFSHVMPVETHAPGSAMLKLQDESMPVRQREQALLLINAHFRSESNMINQEVLSFANEELRLYAFYLLNAQQNQLWQLLGQCLEQLETASADTTRSQCYYRIAAIYWQMVELKLEAPALIQVYLQYAEKYLRQSISIDEQQSTLWALLGKIRCRQHDYDNALQYFNKALSMRADYRAVLPELAEIYYYKRHYDRLKAIWHYVSDFETPHLIEIKKFWETSHGF